MANKKLLKKYGLEEAVKRFNQINEYKFYDSVHYYDSEDEEEGVGLITEDGEDDFNDQEQQPQGNGNDMNGGPQGGGDMPMGGNQPPQPQDNGGGMGGPMDNGNGPEGDDMFGDGPQGGSDMTPADGGEPQDGDFGPDDEEGGEDFDADFDDDDMDDEEDDMDGDIEMEEEGDEVIDVDDLTQSQEASSAKLDGVDIKLTRMLDVIEKFSQAIAQNDQKIADLKREFEKRNPTQQEIMNIRSQASAPFGETPKNYWDKKIENDPRYHVVYDNDVSPADELKKYEITTDDIQNLNIKDILDSFDDEDTLNLDQFIKL